MIVRDANAADIPVILSMLQESATEQGFPDSVGVTESELAADAFGLQPKVYILVADSGPNAVGIAVYFFNYSTWGSRLGLYLEDLYVAPEARGHGVGRALMVRLAQIAVAQSCGRFQWVVHAANASAVGMYEALGAEMLTDWRLMSLKGEAIRRLARSSQSR